MGDKNPNKLKKKKKIVEKAASEPTAVSEIVLASKTQKKAKR